MLDGYIRSMIFTTICTLFLAFLVGCESGGGGGGGGRSVAVSAAVNAEDYDVAVAPTFMDRMMASILPSKAHALSGIGTVDKIVAIPHAQGEFRVHFFDKIKEVSLRSNGSFNISLSSEYDWLLLLVNSQASDIEDKVVAYVAIAGDISSGLVNMPISKASGDLDLGTLSNNGNEAISSNEAGSAEVSFSLSRDQLLEYAKTDESYKNLINTYLNYDPETGAYYILEPAYIWRGDIELLGNEWGDPEDLAFQGYHFFIYTNKFTSPAYSDACSGSGSVTVQPPAQVSLGNGTTFDSSSPMQNDALWWDNGNSCMSGNFIIDDRDSQMWYTVLPGDRSSDILQDIVTGFWQFKYNDNVLASFDISVSKPIDTNGYPLIFLPVAKINHDANGVVQSVNIAWKRYDLDLATYVDADPAVLSAMVYGARYSLQGHDDNVRDDYSPTNGIGTLFPGSAFSRQWSIMGTGGTELERVSIGYKMGSTAFRVSYRPAGS